MNSLRLVPTSPENEGGPIDPSDQAQPAVLSPHAIKLLESLTNRQQILHGITVPEQISLYAGHSALIEPYYPFNSDKNASLQWKIQLRGRRGPDSDLLFRLKRFFGDTKMTVSDPNAKDGYRECDPQEYANIVDLINLLADSSEVPPETLST